MEYRKLGGFNIKTTVSQGGMGEITRSTDEKGRPLALKTILKDFENDPRFRDLFIREAEITFQLDHPNIVKAYHFQEIGNKLVLALEYLDGINVKDVLRKNYDKQRGIPVAIALAMMDRVLRGLHYAHKKKSKGGKPLGIIHRDLNPANLFVTFGGVVKVLDFGISKATQVDVHQLTPQGELRGKMCYLSPEQIRGFQIDHRSDIFMAGIVLWEMIAGKPLFLRDSDQMVMESICNGDYTPIYAVRPEVPESVDQVIRKALAVNPKDRYSTAEEFRVALKRAIDGTRVVPGVNENEISIYVRSLFSHNMKREDPNFEAGLGWIMTQMPGLESRGLAILKDLALERPGLPYVQLNYARAQLTHGNRLEGLRLVKKLTRVDTLTSDVHTVLEWIGVRRKPVFSMLKRENPLNVYCGLLRHKILGPTEYEAEFIS